MAEKAEVVDDDSEDEERHLEMLRSKKKELPKVDSLHLLTPLPLLPPSPDPPPPPSIS